jgi:uncharacterized membrane protein YqgA involved in biofilm formation
MEMLAVLVNTLVVLAGGLLGMLLKGCLKEKHTQTIVAALGLCTVVIGITGAIATSNILIVILCLAAGTLLGELLNMESRLDGAGEWLKKRASKSSNSRFTEGFVTASLLFCVGSMAIMGSFDAGLRGDNSTIFAKSALDGIMAITFGATMGLGVVFSALSVFVYQGLLTLLACLIEPLLSAQSITEMSAVGGVMLMATGLNILGLGKERIRVGNMLPALLLPPVWFALRTLF